MVAENVTKLVDVGGGIGNVAGKGGSILGDITTTFSLFISNITWVEWIFIVFIGIGSLIIWYLKDKYNLKFRLWPKKPKNTFN